jgi:hypothetical protein
MKKSKLYTNLDTGIIVKCTRHSSDLYNFSGYVVNEGRDKFKLNHRSSYWNPRAFTEVNNITEPQLLVIL